MLDSYLRDCCSLLIFQLHILFPGINKKPICFYVCQKIFATNQPHRHCSELGTTRILLALAPNRCCLSPWRQGRSESDFSWHKYQKNLRCFVFQAFHHSFFKWSSQPFLSQELIHTCIFYLCQFSTATKDVRLLGPNFLAFQPYIIFLYQSLSLPSYD